MSGLSPAAVRNYTDTSARFGATKQAAQDRLAQNAGEIVGAGVGAARQAEYEAKIGPELESRGLPAALARDPRAAMQAILGADMEKKRQEFQTAHQERGFAHDVTMDEALGKRQAADDQRRVDAATTATKDARTYAEGQDAASRGRWQGTFGALTAPFAVGQVRDDLGYSPSGVPTAEEMELVDQAPDAQAMSRRIPTIPADQFDPTAAKEAFERIRKPPENPDAKIESEIKKERRLKAEGLGRYVPTEPTPRNIDPNSPEGIEARLRFEKEKAAFEPAKSGVLTDQARARAIFIRNRLGQIGTEILGRDPDTVAALERERKSLMQEYDRIAPPVAAAGGVDATKAKIKELLK